jgi:hypothetical protein
MVLGKDQHGANNILKEQDVVSPGPRALVTIEHRCPFDKREGRGICGRVGCMVNSHRTRAGIYF